jgi:hypothetical protein
MAEEKAQNELKECTFKPMIVACQHSRRVSDIYESLYEEATRKMSKERQAKSSVDWEYEKSASECTFKPNLSKPDLLKMTSRKPLISIAS